MDFLHTNSAAVNYREITFCPRPQREQLRPLKHTEQRTQQRFLLSHVYHYKPASRHRIGE